MRSIGRPFRALRRHGENSRDDLHSYLAARRCKINENEIGVKNKVVARERANNSLKRSRSGQPLLNLFMQKSNGAERAQKFPPFKMGDTLAASFSGKKFSRAQAPLLSIKSPNSIREDSLPQCRARRRGAEELSR
ncbi:hypothetical protein KM043_012781 [Ampulex compressa]|nr:hypothetical protein KM043_012781 [Ampulex compressa]